MPSGRVGEPATAAAIASTWARSNRQRRSRDDVGRDLPLSARFDRQSGTVALSRTYWALVLAQVALTAAGACWGAGAWAGAGRLSWRWRCCGCRTWWAPWCTTAA